MPDPSQKRPVIALTGATGYIGRNVMESLIDDYDIIALSRNGDAKDNEEHVEWRSCDFFSFQDALKGLRGADYAVYLIHSMLPSAKLTQGTFEDMDVILAQHFARAAAENGIKQIVYLSGIIPPHEHRDELSRHLQSRLEVETILGSHGVPVTTLRAGLIVGPDGSSFPILAKLVRRLPAMILPSWTRTKTHTIALPDVIHAFQQVVGREDVYSRAIDIGGPDVMSYQELLQRTADIMGKKRRFIPFPFPTVKLSRLWVTLVTQEPKEMSYPLIESLAHPMVAEARQTVPGISDGKITYEEAAAAALDEEQKKQEEKKREQEEEGSKTPSPVRKLKQAVKSDVRSVQRITLPEGQDAIWAGDEYLHWLSRLASPLLHIKTTRTGVQQVYVLWWKKPLLELTFDVGMSQSDHAIYRITGGRLLHAKRAHNGRLTFLQIPNSRECIVAIHDYMPSLPWVMYKYTQAKIHLWVMKAFGKYLRRWKHRSTTDTKAAPRQAMSQHDSTVR
ncbi:NAD(P)H-binding protein [Paenibacillus lemnae]|uniref:NAD(P)H-binding protein n=1 Tax=Paenibacillus lemnae TaxID=1330551 RepID=A0A848M973_PAELE|nr:NAD(P)H-binding protein [Paenibacillus lemnae]NMO96720.1 NAD(P)H-binding protein [Paenibacillus lemnae]